MQDHFFTLSDAVAARLHGNEGFLATFRGEASQFVRFNTSAVRQPGTVEQRKFALELFDGKRHANASMTLTGAQSDDLARIDAALTSLREILAVTDEDPLFLINTTPQSIVGQTITINGIPFTIIGVTQPKGGSGFSNPDDVVFAPITAVQARFTGANTLRTVGVSLDNPDNLALVESEISALLRQRHGLASTASDDFSMVSQDQLLTVASTTSATLRNFLIGIAAIALVVGGIGIANTMLVSVRERVREIGTRKAIGARRRDISRQFLVEAIIVTLGGAVVGVLLGIALTGPVGSAVNVPASPSLAGIVLAFVSALLVGVLAGYWPARQAARLDPVEALRYE